jgi:hypothetical protein
MSFDAVKYILINRIEPKLGDAYHIGKIQRREFNNTQQVNSYIKTNMEQIQSYMKYRDN